NPGELYNSLGRDYMLGEQADYFNFGYWPAKDYDDACVQLTLRLAAFTNINPNDTVLHAGCGFGQELKDITTHYEGVTSIGINLSDYQLNHAQKKFKSQNTEFLKASAISLPFMNNAFDKIIALESAMHFATREQFMVEAFRCLKPKGQIGFADILVKKEKMSLYWRLWIKLASKIMHVPLCNFYDIEEYTLKMKQAGF